MAETKFRRDNSVNVMRKYRRTFAMAGLLVALIIAASPAALDRMAANEHFGKIVLSLDS